MGYIVILSLDMKEANTSCIPSKQDVELMLVHRLQRWPNNKPATSCSRCVHHDTKDIDCENSPGSAAL